MGESVLLLVTILLVLIAAVTLLIGIFGNNLALIFVSIGSSVVAALVLAALSQMSKRRVREETAVPSSMPTAPPPPPEPTRVEPTVSPIEEPTIATAAATGVVSLPIANYDGLRVNEIMPLLEELDLDQLEAVAQHEEDNKNR